MRLREKPFYLPMIRKESLPDEFRKKYIRVFKRGGLKKYEKEVADKLADISIDQPIFTDPLTRERYRWVYVGNFWWARRRKLSKKSKVVFYEFARWLAIENNNHVNICGLWNYKLHHHRETPKIVWRKSDKIKGFVVASNEFEILVEWVEKGVRGIAVPISNIDDIDFEYIEDYERYVKILTRNVSSVEKFSEVKI